VVITHSFGVSDITQDQLALRKCAYLCTTLAMAIGNQVQSVNPILSTLQADFTIHLQCIPSHGICEAMHGLSLEGSPLELFFFV